MTNEFELLDELAAAAKEKHYPIYRIAMYMDGRLEERELIPAPECIALYSVSKNYITAGCGMAIDEGALAYDTTVWDLFSAEKPYLDERWKCVTLETVLSQTTGCGGMFLDIDCDDAFSWGESDWLDAVLKKPFIHKPNTVFDYTDSNFYIASRMLSKATGKRANEYLSHRLFEKMKMQGWAWSCCPLGHAVGGSGLYLRCRDMAKFGAMILSGGVFEGERYLSEDFCRRATSPISHPERRHGLRSFLLAPEAREKLRFPLLRHEQSGNLGKQKRKFHRGMAGLRPTGSADADFNKILNK